MKRDRAAGAGTATFQYPAVFLFRKKSTEKIAIIEEVDSGISRVGAHSTILARAEERRFIRKDATVVQ